MSIEADASILLGVEVGVGDSHPLGSATWSVARIKLRTLTIAKYRVTVDTGGTFADFVCSTKCFMILRSPTKDESGNLFLTCIDLQCISLPLCHAIPTRHPRTF